MKMKNLLLCLLALIVVAPAWGGPAKPLVTSVTIELNNLTKTDDVSVLVAKLEKDAVYKAAGCGTADTSKGPTKIDCAKGDSGLMGFLSKNAPPSVMWSVTSLIERKCATGCSFMHCPPPSGPMVCCNTSTFQACPP